MATKANICGKRFGALVALEPKRSNDHGHGVTWAFACDCGALLEKTVARVRRDVEIGVTPSCGCVKAPGTYKNVRKGTRRHALYEVWKGMRSRCNNVNNNQYQDYGGRGISVCDRWNSYDLFFQDMSPEYRKGLTLDRKDNSGSYNAENCHFISVAKQQRNRRDSNKINTPIGRMILVDAAKVFRISEKTLRTRVNRGWPYEKLFTPPQYCGSRSLRAT